MAKLADEVPRQKRFLDAGDHIQSCEIPLQENDPDMLIVNRILGKEFPLSLHAYELPIDDYLELNRKMGNDLIYFAEIWRLGRKEQTDAEGRIHYVDGVMKTRRSIKDIKFPDLGETRKCLEKLLTAIEGTGFGVICYNKHAPAEVATAMGLEDYWANCLLDPSFVRDFQEKVHEYCLRELELFSQYQVDAISMGAFLAVNSGPICSRETREQILWPYLREQIQLAHDNNIVVCLHADGNVSTLVDEFIELGVGILHPVEPCDNTQDIYNLKEEFGRSIALWGNIDVESMLTKGRPEQVLQDTLEHMQKLATGGGYIVGSSHKLSPRVAIENLYAMRDAVHEYRFRAA